MRKRLFEIIEPAAGSEDRVSSGYDVFMIVLIVVSLIPLAFKTETPFLAGLDRACASVFVLDYLARLITADFRYRSRSALSFARYPFSFMALVDLLSILPSFSVLNGSFKVLRVMRMFRALRVFRVFKAVRYSRSIQIILRVIAKSRDALAAVGTLALAYVLICALVILNVEPDTFDGFFDAVYWATISLTTMGYGDIYPVTGIGRLFTMISSFFGIALVALPAGVVTAGYMSEVAAAAEAPEE